MTGLLAVVVFRSIVFYYEALKLTKDRHCTKLSAIKTFIYNLCKSEQTAAQLRSKLVTLA